MEDPKRVSCKLCAEVGIEKIISRYNFSRHVKNIHKINNGISSELGLDDERKSYSSTKSSKAVTLQSAMQINNNSDESHEPGGTSKPASSAHASASSSSQRVTLKSFYHTIEDDPTRVRCKLCAMVGIEKVICRDNFSKHVKDIHEARASEKEKCVHCGKMYRRSTIQYHIKYTHGDGKWKEKKSCEHCDKLITRKHISKHRKRCTQKNKELNE